MADIAKSVRAFSVGTSISRVLGLVREQVFAFLFGAGFASDAFNAAFRIPNLLRDLFAENALSNAFVPILSSARTRGKEAENRFASDILNVLLLTVGLLTVAGIIFAPWLARLIAPGFGDIPGKTALTARLAVILFPFLLFVVLAAWAMSYLNTEGDFFVPALSPAFFNVFSILVPLALFGYYKARGQDPILGMAIGVTIGGFVQFVVHVPSLRRRGFVYHPYLSFRDPEFRQAMSLFLPVAVGLSSSRINVFINTLLISFLQQGSISWLNFAYRIFFLPLGVFGVAVGQVSLSSFSRAVSENRMEDIRETLADSMRMVLFLTIPTSAMIAFLAVPVTGVIYEHGRFTPADTAATAAILVLYMIGVPFVSALRNVAAVFYAFKDARGPMAASFASVGVNIALNLALMGVLGYRAFPLSSSIGAIVNLAILLALLPKKIGAFPARPLARYAGLLTLASLVAGAAAWGGSIGIIGILGGAVGGRFVPRLAAVLVAGPAGLLAFYGLCRLFGVGEARDYVRRFLKI